jgi:hypothetical protein
MFSYLLQDHSPRPDEVEEEDIRQTITGTGRSNHTLFFISGLMFTHHVAAVISSRYRYF